MTDELRDIQRQLRMIAARLESLDTGRLPDHVAMARGVVVLDENLNGLADPLRAMNLHVKVPDAGTPDETIMADLLPGRIFITRNTRDFRDFASSYQYGIVALENIRFIDNRQDNRNQTARLIASAMSRYRLWSKRHGFILTLHEDGQHEYEDLVD